MQNITDQKYLRKNGKEPPGKNFVTIILIAVAIELIGSLIMMLPVSVLSAFISDGGWRFLIDAYLPFLGGFAAMLVYLYIFDPGLFRGVLSKGHGGLERNTLKWLVLGFVFGMALNVLCAVVASLHGDLKFSVRHFDVIYMTVSLILVAIQSSTEELILRGYVFRAIERKYGLLMATVAASVLFSLMHIFNPGIGPLPLITLVLWSVFCCLYLYCFDSLWFICMVHTAWNYTQNFLLGLPNSGLVTERSFLHLEASSGSIFYDFSFGLEGGLTALLEFGIISLVLIVWFKRNKPETL